jgi:hypothetical protein
MPDRALQASPRASAFLIAATRLGGVSARAGYDPLREIVAELSGLQGPGDLVVTEDDAGRHCFRADQLE